MQKDLIGKLEKEQEVSTDSLLQLRSQLNRLESEKAALSDQLARTSRLLDTELRDFKAKVYGEISRNYKDFQNAIKNMEVNLQNIKSAFINPGELELFNNTIDSLNKSRDEMDENYLAYVQYSRQYWGRDKADNLAALYDQALEELYKKQIIPLNNELISRLKAAWSGEKSRIAMQKQAWKYVKKNLNALNVEIQKMESMSGLVLKSLESLD